MGEHTTENRKQEEKDMQAQQEQRKNRLARLESFRQVMLVLAPILLIGGYMSDLLPVLYASVLPLLAALLVTYRIKWLEEGPKK